MQLLKRDELSGLAVDRALDVGLAKGDEWMIVDSEDGKGVLLLNEDDHRHFYEHAPDDEGLCEELAQLEGEQRFILAHISELLSISHTRDVLRVVCVTDEIMDILLQSFSLLEVVLQLLRV